MSSLLYARAFPNFKTTSCDRVQWPFATYSTATYVMPPHPKHFSSDFHIALQAPQWVEILVSMCRCCLDTCMSWQIKQGPLFCPNSEGDRARFGLELDLRQGTETELFTTVKWETNWATQPKIKSKTLIQISLLPCNEFYLESVFV